MVLTGNTPERFPPHPPMDIHNDNCRSDRLSRVKIGKILSAHGFGAARFKRGL
jgi:hypothetical protein